MQPLLCLKSPLHVGWSLCYSINVRSFLSQLFSKLYSVWSQVCYSKFRHKSFHFYCKRTSVLNIDYQFPWSLIIGIRICPEKPVSVNPYYMLPVSKISYSCQHTEFIFNNNFILCGSAQPSLPYFLVCVIKTVHVVTIWTHDWPMGRRLTLCVFVWCFIKRLCNYVQHFTMFNAQEVNLLRCLFFFSPGTCLHPSVRKNPFYFISHLTLHYRDFFLIKAEPDSCFTWIYNCYTD